MGVLHTNQFVSCNAGKSWRKDFLYHRNYLQRNETTLLVLKHDTIIAKPSSFTYFKL